MNYFARQAWTIVIRYKQVLNNHFDRTISLPASVICSVRRMCKPMCGDCTMHMLITHSSKQPDVGAVLLMSLRWSEDHIYRR